jgi:hypothetical protein
MAMQSINRHTKALAELAQGDAPRQPAFDSGPVRVIIHCRFHGSTATMQSEITVGCTVETVVPPVLFEVTLAVPENVPVTFMVTGDEFTLV